MDIFRRERGVYTFGPFRLDPVRRALLRDGERVKLGSRLFETLLYMVVNHDRLVEREELQAAVWQGRAVDENSLGQAISALRKALQSDGSTEAFIVTSPGRGYRFGVPVDFEPAETNVSLVTPVRRQEPVETPGSKPPIAAGNGWLQRRSALLAIAALVIAAIGGMVWDVLPPRAHKASGNAASFMPPAHSVAVTAFTNLSGDPAQEYFSDGLSEELINSLGRIQALHVAGRLSAFSFKGKTVSVSDIARSLNVGAVLEGSVRRLGTRVRITAQLVDAATGYQLWSNGYDRDEHDILQVQEEIAQAVTTSLRVTLLGDAVARLTVGSTANPTAFDAYLRGMKLIRGGDMAGFHAALAEFDKALATDPAFARGYAGRSYALGDIAMNTPSTDSAPIRKIWNDCLASADRAIALAPTLAAGHSARASALDNGFLDPRGAAHEAAQSLALEPGNAAIQNNFAQVAMDIGHVNDGVAAARRSTELDPLRPDAWQILAYVLFEARQYEEARAALQHAKAIYGTLPSTAFDISYRIDLMMGKLAAAQQDCSGASDGIQYECFAIVDHALGRRDEAAAQLAKFRASEGDAPYGFADIYAQWGQQADALDALERAYRERDLTLSQMKTDPLLDSIRDTKRFKDVERQMNFPP